MHPVIHKTLGGLSPQYYFRQLFFGAALFALFVFMESQSPRSTPISLWFFLGISTLLYPYSRFVYESLIGFIMGENVFVVRAPVLLFVKLMTMLMCWILSIIIAPIGLAYLYFHHSRVAS